MKRLFMSLLRPLRLISVEHPHGGIVAGARTALVVRAVGHGTLGRGDDARAVDGAFDGVIFAPVVDGHAVVEARGLLRRDHRRIVVTAIAVPSPPQPPRPALPPLPGVTVPSVALPVFDVSIEVP